MPSPSNESHWQKVGRLLANDVSSAAGTAKDIVGRGVVAPILGLPMDMFNLGARRPEHTGSSEYFGEQMQDAGIVSPDRNYKSELAASLLNPAAISAKAAAIPALAATFAGKGAKKITPYVDKYGRTVRPSDSVTKAAKYIEDIPTERWLKEKQDYSLKEGLNEFGAPYSMGSDTGNFDRFLNIPVSKLAEVKGLRGEQRMVRQDSLDWIRNNWDSVKNEPAFMVIDPTGKAWISEGNHRIMVAKERGESYFPTEVRYFSGGNRTAGSFDPDNLIKLDLEINNKNLK